MTILNLFIISIIWVLILDLSGFAQTIDRTLYKIIYKGRPYREDAHFKPFDCSLCMTWWTGLLYLLITHTLSIFNIAILLVFAWSTTMEKDIFILIKDIVTKLLDLLYRTLNL